MSLFKTVKLPGDTWSSITATLERLNTEETKRWASLIREQATGQIKVTTSRATTRISAGKGGDVRNSILGSDLF